MGLVRSLVLTLAVALTLPGCCALFCSVAAPESPPRFTRDSPDEAVSFLTDAFAGRRIADIYNSIHPDLRERFGGFSQADFTAAFEHFEHLFLEDSRRFAKARRSLHWLDGPAGRLAGVHLQDGDMSVLVIFKNRPLARITSNDEMVPEATALVAPLDELLRIDGDSVAPAYYVDFKGFTGTDPRAIKRLEYHSDWLFYDYAKARNVRFIERLEEEFED